MGTPGDLIPEFVTRCVGPGLFSEFMCQFALAFLLVGGGFAVSLVLGLAGVLTSIVRWATSRLDSKRCTNCAELIRRGAVQCRFCGSPQPSAPY